MKKLSFLFTIACMCALIVSCDKIPTRPGGGTNPGGGDNGGNDSNNVVCVDKDAVRPNMDCPKDLRPVCGCNDVTYRNACDAKRHGVRKWREGACRPKGDGTPGDSTNVRPCIDKRLIDPNAACPEYFRPVCGCDGKTYTNPCEAKTHGVTRWKEGRCDGKPGDGGNDSTGTNTCIDRSKIDPNAVCPTVHKPVCGCNGRTYMNACTAEAHGVTKWKEGPCGGIKPPVEDCINKDNIDPDRECPREAAPVCGCNGQTYLNACDAKRHGVTRWKDGKCGSNLPPR